MVGKILSILALVLPTAAHAEWMEASSKHFVVYSDDQPERVREFTKRLETYDKAMRQLRGMPEDRRGESSRVTVFVADDVDEIQKLAGRSGIAGFYQARASGSVAFVPRNAGSNSRDNGLTPQVILFHEYAHHWMLSNWTDAAFPPWFVEGFAEFHATARFKPDGSVTFGAPPTYRAYTVSRLNLLPASRLLRFNLGRLDGMERDALYSRGWALTHYLTFDAERRKQLAAYIKAINSHESAEKANATLGNISTLDLRLSSYVQHALPVATISASELDIGEIKVRTLSAGEAAVMPARMMSTRGVTKETAPRVAELARRLAAPFPNDAAAQNVLAEAEFDAGNYAAAEAAADRALAADSKSVHALIYKGKAKIETARAAKATDRATWQSARQWLIAANRANPEDPYPLVEFYDSFASARQPPTESAKAGLLYAYALAPYDGSLRLKATQIYLEQGKAAEARIALAPVAYSIDDRSSSFAVKALETLDASGPSAALTVLKDGEEEARRKAEENDKGTSADKDKKDKD